MFENIKGKFLSSVIVFSLCMLSSTFAVSVLNPGDIFFITINSNPDYFEIVSPINIDTGTVIRFSDNARNVSNRKTPITEGNITFTSSRSITGGTIIKFSGADTASPTVTPSGIGTVLKNGSFDLSTIGEQIFAYQGSIIYDPAASFLYGFGFGTGVSWITSGIPTSNNSYLPAPLIIGTSANSTSFRNIQYNCQNVGILSPTFSSDINNLANWTGKNTSAGYGASPCIFDTIAPTATIDFGSGQQSITSGTTIKYNITFSESITTGSFDCSDIIFSGSAGGKTCVSINQIAPNNGTTFEVITSVTSDGTISINLQTGSVNDSSGNPYSTQTIINNTVTINNILPIIILSGNSSITLLQNSIYNESGALWTDVLDGTGFISIATSGTVNTSILGTYILEYSYTNSIGNKGSIIRTVIVADQTPPSISTGSSSINEGNSVTINVVNLTTDTNAISGYDFDIDNNGTIDFSNTSGILTLTWNQLQSFGISGNNATLLPTDFYTIRLYAKDSSNNIGTGFFQLKVYNIAPVVTITEPIISGTIYTGTLPIQWSIIDPADQDFPMNTDIFLSSNGTSYIPLATTTSNRTGTLLRDTTTVPDYGSYTIRVRSLDDYGNNTTTSIPFKIDNHGPSISGQLTYTIAEGDTITFSLTGTTDAVAGISGFIRTIGSNITGTSTGLLSLTWAQLQSGGINNDGTYTIGVQAIDNIGNISTKNLTLIITNTAPSLSITNPASSIYSGNISISRTATEPASADLPLNTVISYNNGINSGVIIQGTNLTNPYNRNVASIPDGTGYRITITTSDDDTSTSVSGNIFSIDHTKPIINGFSGNYIINEGSGLTIDLRTTTDAIAGLSGGLAGFIGTINGINLPNTTNGYRNLSRSNLSTYGITNGSGQSYPITIQVTDAIGNNSTTSGNLTVLNVKPTISITSPSSSLNNVVGTLPIQRTTNDPVDTLLQTSIYYASTVNGPRTLLGSGLSSSFSGLLWNTTTVSDGVYYIKATATDDKDTVNTIQGPITINNIPDFVGGGGGGGGGSTPSDYCPKGDYSKSKYDGTCGTAPSSGDIQQSGEDTLESFEDNEIFNTDIQNGYCYTRIGSGTITSSNSITTSEEFKKALIFLYAHNMTMFNDVRSFSPYTNLTREQAAKIFSNFAINVLCRKPDTSITPSYNDISNANISLKPYITKAYQLGLMKGGDNGSFRPFDTITKAEFNAVLIRMILKSYLDENGDTWYNNYNKVGTQLGIIKKGATSTPIMRHDATLMMFRAYKNQRFSLQEIDYTSYVLKNRSTYLP